MSLLMRVGNFAASNPKYTLAGIITANMVCRPMITMSNKEIPADTRKYTASREFCTELFGLANLFAIGTLFEFLGGQIVAKKVLGKFLTKAEFINIGRSALNTLSPENAKIKSGILIASFVGSILSSAIATPLLNNKVLNKFMKKSDEKKDKNPEVKEINPTKPLDKQENIFEKYNMLLKSK